MRFLLLFIALHAFPIPIFAAVHEVWWNFTYVEGINPDGLTERRVVGVNNTWPPPPLEISTTDSLVIHALNSLDRPTSLHHYGLPFTSSPWMDGTIGVSECGIPPGGSFDYVIPINASNQTGTYWVYAPTDTVDGLRTPLVLHSPKETYTYDSEYTVVVGDWYHDEHDKLRSELLSIGNPAGVEPVPNSGLIYFAQNGTYLPPSAGSTPSTTPNSVGFNADATISFQSGKTYRLRVVNTSAYATFFFWLDGHDMRIIEVDGVDVAETHADVLRLAAGQRYSVLVTSRGDSSSNWAIHANMDASVFRDAQHSVNANVTSSITYTPSGPLSNLQTISAYNLVDDLSLSPVQHQVIGTATKNIEVDVTFETLDDGKNYGMFNRITYSPPIVPALLSELTLGNDASNEQAYGPLSFVVGRNDIVDLVVTNSDTRAHPFYLHGHKLALMNGNSSNPMRRDTVYVPPRTSSVLRFVADNPGVWLFQSPVVWNSDAGLVLQLIEAPVDAQAFEDSFPKEAMDNCVKRGIPTSGNAAGHTAPTDLSGLHVGPFPQRMGWTPKAIGIMFSCVLSAVLGMASVAWYSFGGNITDEEYEQEAKAKLDAKDRRRGAALRLIGRK